MVTTVVALGLVPGGAEPARSQATPNPPLVAGPATDAAETPTPLLKPQARDRSAEVVALLKHATAAPAGSSTAVVEEAAAPAIPAPPTPRLKPRAPTLDPIIAHFRRVLGGASDRRPAPGAAEPQVVRAPVVRAPVVRAQVVRAPVISAAPGDTASAEASAGDSTAQDDSIELLRRELQARDAVIANLMARVEQLERRVVLNAAQLDQAVAGAAPPRPGIGSATHAVAAAPEPAPEPEAPRAEQVAAANQAPDRTAPPAAAPGQFEVDEAAIDRALERTLVQEGVLLLPLGQAEIDPSFSYTRQEDDAPTFVTQNGSLFAGEQEVRRNEFESRTALRVGLPFDSQLEVDVPYRSVDQSTVTKVDFQSRDSSDRWGSGLGDIRVGAAKTLLRENGGWWPDLIGRAFWDTDTGKSRDNGVFLGGGFHEVGGSLSAVKRQDPLAFVGGAFYTKAFENDDIEPGDELGFSLGAFLAASPETSMRFVLNQSFVDDFKVDGDNVDGSDQVIGTVTIGASTLLGRNVLLDISADIGLTDDAPDYAARASVPIRFNLPVY